MNKEPFCLELEVRDYECDMQGIVNNAVYQNYLEHARHLFLKSVGLDFAALTEQKINLVVIRAELDYKSSLKSGDHFAILTHFERVSKLRFLFHQDIVLLPERKMVLAAKIFGTSLNEKGRPYQPAILEKL